MLDRPAGNLTFRNPAWPGRGHQFPALNRRDPTPPRSRHNTTPSRGEAAIARRQSALLRLSASIASAHSESDVCRAVVDGLHDEALGYDFLGVFLLDPPTGDRVLGAAVGWADIPADMRVPPGRGLSARPLLDGKLRYTPDVACEPEYVPGLSSGSEVDVPIQAGDESLGVLVVESREPHAFGPGDFEILTAAAQHAGIALARIRLLEEQRRLLGAERRLRLLAKEPTQRPASAEELGRLLAELS